MSDFYFRISNQSTSQTVLVFAFILSGCVSDSDMMSVMQAGMSGNANAILATGVQVAKNAEREQARREAAAREAARIAELKKTEKGRRQLAREEEERKQAAKKQEETTAAFAAALFGGGGGSDTSDGYQVRCKLAGGAIITSHVGCQEALEDEDFQRQMYYDQRNMQMQ